MDKDILLTVTVSPKRKVLVTGAPVGETPVIRRGSFADLHRLVDEVWVALLRREPQVVKQVKAAGDKAVAAELKAEPVEVEPETVEAEPETAEPETVEADPESVEPVGDQVDAASMAAQALSTYEQPGLI